MEGLNCKLTFAIAFLGTAGSPSAWELMGVEVCRVEIATAAGNFG
jgi:hypothetical protein